MGFRFQRRIRIAPGVRLNLSRSGISTSVGGRGFTLNSRGTATVGIPGTGLSYRANLKAPAGSSNVIPLRQQSAQPVNPQQTSRLDSAYHIWDWHVSSLQPGASTHS